MTEKEQTLIAACLRRDKAAWDSFVAQYSNLIYHTIKKTLNLHHVETRADFVEDLYQEFFLSLLRNEYKKLRQFRGAHGCSLPNWLRILAARLTIDFLGRRVRLWGGLKGVRFYTATILRDHRSTSNGENLV